VSSPRGRPGPDDVTVVNKGKFLRRFIAITGAAGFLGPCLVMLGAVTSSSEVGLAGVILIGVCELALVALLARVSPVAVGCAVVTLAVGVFVAAVGISTANLLIMPGYLAIGLLCWMVVAPVASVLVAHAGLLSVAPAAALTAVTVIWLALSLTRLTPDNPAVVVIVGGYLVSWIWIGAAMVRRGLARDVSDSVPQSSS